MYIFLWLPLQNVDDELLGRYADTFGLYGNHFLPTPAEHRLVKLPDLVINGDAYCHIGPARHV